MRYLQYINIDIKLVGKLVCILDSIFIRRCKASLRKFFHIRDIKSLLGYIFYSVHLILGVGEIYNTKLIHPVSIQVKIVIMF